MTKKIALKVLALVAQGQDPVDALRSVCGAENVDRMIGELYDTLRADAKVVETGRSRAKSAAWA